ncbi:HtaA domain-containing protein [Microbacterium sp. NIBRBAC000506063]|nr:HtaA domain-containing protein [Microbacterium sp. NIBRBAC000506063]
MNQVFAGYSTSLNPVTFTIGAAASAPAGASGTVASAASDEDSVELPASPPATDGIEAEAESLAAFSTGGAGTFSASGFEANEEGIKVVVYSTPVLLDTVTADADGVATWTGAVPATLADGEHTLTFQGSVDRGLVFTLERGATSLAVGPCLVEGATLSWGFKESFRVYIEGIAKGGWDLTDVEYQYPDYVWTSGTGAIDPDAATGLVTLGGKLAFHGHDGALDTKLNNARIELAGERGYIVFDITGTTQEGDDVDLADVRFAEFSLEGAEISDGVLTLDALPATLTDAGAAAFGTYPAGEELDPVSAVIPVAADCGAPVEAEPIVEAAPIEEAPEESDAGGAPVWPWIAGGVLLALLLGIGIGVLATRGRKPAAAEVAAE